MTFLAILDPKFPQGLDFGSEHNQDRWRMYVDDNRGKRVKVMIPKKLRSLSQNNYYWFYLGIIENESGNSSSDLHEYFKRVFLPPKFIQVLGKELKVPKSTSELTKAEFGEYLDKICAETNVPLPDPTEAGFITNY